MNEGNNDDEDDIDERLASALRRLIATGALDSPLHWRPLTSHSGAGVVVIVRDHLAAPETYWCGPLAPNHRSSRLWSRNSTDGQLYPVPIALFASYADAWRAYHAYINNCAARHCPRPAIMRMQAVDP